jgi:glutamyl-tRNA(Gln) amidotransferase subunit E
MNTEALDIGLTAAAMLDCEIPDEIHVMRKQVIDGSNTTGFQRTAIVGLKGTLQTQKGKVGITNVSVEEEACQILGTDERSVTYGLDRLSIPLVEIGTSPDIKHPEQAKEVCQAIGMFLRSTGKVKRGIGTIRQDINISIRGGARIEIKGSQELKLIPALIEREAERQLALVQIMDELKDKGFIMIPQDGTDVTQIFTSSNSNITRGKTTYALKIPRLSGFFRKKLTQTRTLGNEIANYARARAGVKGIIHTDEDLEKYNLAQEFKALAKFMDAKERDMLVIVSGDESRCRKAVSAVTSRVNQLLRGVPEETRKALESGDSEYMRPLPGSARMYPETDIPPIPLGSGKLHEIRKNLPELIEDRIARYKKEYRIHEELARNIIQSGFSGIFEKAAKILLDPVLVASTLTSTLTCLRRESVPVEKLTEEHLLDIFRALHARKFAKEKLPDVLKAQTENPDLGIEKVLEKAGTEALQLDQLRHIVKDVVSTNQQALTAPNPEKALMGLVMARVRGKISGKIVAEVLKEEIDKAGR